MRTLLIAVLIAGCGKADITPGEGSARRASTPSPQDAVVTRQESGVDAPVLMPDGSSIAELLSNKEIKAVGEFRIATWNEHQMAFVFVRNAKLPDEEVKDFATSALKAEIGALIRFGYNPREHRTTVAIDVVEATKTITNGAKVKSLGVARYDPSVDDIVWDAN